MLNIIVLVAGWLTLVAGVVARVRGDRELADDLFVGAVSIGLCCIIGNVVYLLLA